MLKKELCVVCNEQRHRYVCPRCGIIYCSLGCYKRHNEKCVETFSQEQIVSHLKSQKATIDETKEFEKLLSKLHSFSFDEDTFGVDEADEEGEEDAVSKASSDEDEEEEEGDIEEARLENLIKLAEDGELTMENLTEVELKMFQSALRSSKLDEHLGVFTPWWIDINLTALGSVCTPPHVCCGMRSFPPNILVGGTVVQICYAYVHLMRMTLGDWKEDLGASGSHLLALCECIYVREPPPPLIVECLMKQLRAATQPPIHSQDLAFNVKCIQDVINILESKEKASYMLKEVKDIVFNCFKEGNLSSKKEIGNIGGSMKMKSFSVGAASKKLQFMMSVVQFHWSIVQTAADELPDILKRLTPEKKEKTLKSGKTGFLIKEEEEEEVKDKISAKYRIHTSKHSNEGKTAFSYDESVGSIRISSLLTLGKETNTQEKRLGIQKGVVEAGGRVQCVQQPSEKLEADRRRKSANFNLITVLDDSGEAKKCDAENSAVEEGENVVEE